MNENPEPTNVPRPNPLEKLTLAGRLLFIVTFLLFGAGFYFSFFFFADNFPTGSYPLVFILMPVCLGCFFFFLFVAWVLERCGIQIYANKPSNNPEA
jgi:hypothetical protein